MVSEGNLVAPRIHRRLVQRATPHLRTKRAGVRLLPHLEDYLGNLGLDNPVFNVKSAAKFLNLRKILTLKSHIHRDRHDIIFLGIKTPHLGKPRKQGKRVLSTRYTDGNPVPVLYHSVVIHGTADEAHYPL